MERLKGLNRSDGYRSKVAGNTRFQYFGVYLWITLSRCNTHTHTRARARSRLAGPIDSHCHQTESYGDNSVHSRHLRHNLLRQATDDMHAMGKYTQVIRTFKKETSNRRHACHEGQPQYIPSIRSHQNLERGKQLQILVRVCVCACEPALVSTGDVKNNPLVSTCMQAGLRAK